jgi:hypothetical protein
MANKYGVRIYPPNPDSSRILILQTIKRQKSPRYVINIREDGKHETFADVDDSVTIANTVQRYLKGELK